SSRRTANGPHVVRDPVSIQLEKRGKNSKIVGRTVVRLILFLFLIRPPCHEAPMHNLNRARARRHPYARLEVEPLENRCLPAVMNFTTPMNGMPDVVTLQLDTSGTKLTLLLNGVVQPSQTQSLQSLTNVIINGVGGEPDTLVLNYSAGVFNKPIQFNGGV